MTAAPGRRWVAVRAVRVDRRFLGRGGDEALQRGVLSGVVGVVVVPDAPDDLAPGAAEDAGGVRVAGASGTGAVIDVCRPGVVAAACVRERAERRA